MIAYTKNEFNDLLIEKGIPILSHLIKSECNYGSPVPFDNEVPLDVQVPVLFRGCHLAELHRDVNLSNIQGRPEDTSYNGDILHLTSEPRIAFEYAEDNASRKQFEDKRVCIVAYNTRKLSMIGWLDADIVDSNNAKSQIESLKACMEIRWRCGFQTTQIERLDAIEFILYQCKMYKKEDLQELIDQPTNETVKTRQEDEALIKHYEVENPLTHRKHYLQVVQHSSGHYVSEYEMKTRATKVVFNPLMHRYLSIGGHTYMSDYDIVIRECEVDDHLGEFVKGTPSKWFHHHFVTIDDDEPPKFLLRAVYPVKI